MFRCQLEHINQSESMCSDDKIFWVIGTGCASNSKRRPHTGHPNAEMVGLGEGWNLLQRTPGEWARKPYAGLGGGEGMTCARPRLADEDPPQGLMWRNPHPIRVRTRQAVFRSWNGGRAYTLESNQHNGHSTRSRAPSNPAEHSPRGPNNGRASVAMPFKLQRW